MRRDVAVRTLFVVALAALVAASCGRKEEAAREKTPPAPPAAAFGPWGVDLSAADPATRPGDDFWRHANGAWIERFRIPENRSSYGLVTQLAERAQARVIAALAAAASAPAGSAPRKAADFHASYLDVAAIDAKGLAPIAGDLAAIEKIETASELVAAFGRKDWRAASPIDIAIAADVRRPDRYAVVIGQGGLGLPDRDWYFEDKHAAARADYGAYVATLFRLAGVRDGVARSAAVVALEERLAAQHWEPAKRRNGDLAWSARTRAELAAFAPGVDWTAFLAAAGLASRDAFVLREDEAVQKIARLIEATPIGVWRDYLLFHLLDRNADVLPQVYDRARQDFRRRTNGAAEASREARALAATDEAVGDAVGALYAAGALPAPARTAVMKIAADVEATLAERLGESKWMSEPTRRAAREKLARLTLKIGHDDRRRDYAALDVVRGDAYGNARRAAAFAWSAALARLDGPIDAADFPVSPQTVDAYYDEARNELVFPAAVLQPPLFDPAADAAVNYGAIGALIGHEMTHVVDGEGRRTDAEGLRRDWWTGADAAAYEKRLERLGARYAAEYGAAGGDPARVLGEIAGDLGGLELAYGAWRRSLVGVDAPVRDGLTGDQRFFLSWAQIWRRAVREPQRKQEIAEGPRPPEAFRVNGVVRNLDAWHSAYGVRPGDRLWLAPDERVHIW